MCMFYNFFGSWYHSYLELLDCYGSNSDTTSQFTVFTVLPLPAMSTCGNEISNKLCFAALSRFSVEHLRVRNLMNNVYIVCTFSDANLIQFTILKKKIAIIGTCLSVQLLWSF